MNFIILITLGFISYCFIGIYRSYAVRKGILDHPNERSSHKAPLPLGAGILFSFMWVFLMVFLHKFGFAKLTFLFTLFPPIFLISFTGFLDDRYRLAARWRFLAQIIAVLYTIVIIGDFVNLDLGFVKLPLAYFGSIFIALVLLWSTNLYNFMDGMDGISAVEGAFVFGFGGYFLFSSGSIGFAYAAWGMASIVIGFLLWNKPPAKIFMGDSGSTLLGFFVALFAIIGEKKYHVPFLIWMILYGVFWFDATVTLIRRFLHGEKCYLAHKLHAFQRLQLLGWSHGKILSGIIAVNVVLAFFALGAFYYQQYLLLFFGLSSVFLLVIYCMIEKLVPMYD